MNSRVVVIGLFLSVWYNAAYCAARDNGKLLFSIRATENALGDGAGVGYEFSYYITDDGLVMGYFEKAGTVRDVFGGGTNSSDLLKKQLKNLAFESLDFDAELRSATSAYQDAMKKEGKPILGPVALDGAEYEIKFSFEGVNFLLKRFNPHVEVDFYAPYSRRLEKLRALIDLFALHYGRSKFGLD